MSGKGSSRRPAAIPRAEADANWERTFGTQERFSAYHRGEATAPDGYVDIRIVNERDDRRDHDRHPSNPL